MSKENDRIGASPATVQSNVVRVVVPAEVAFDLDKIQAVQKDILKRLGCLACCSGWDIRFDMEREFIVDQQLNIRSVNQT
jgi:hypothetical protein